MDSVRTHSLRRVTTLLPSQLHNMTVVLTTLSHYLGSVRYWATSLFDLT